MTSGHPTTKGLEKTKEKLRQELTEANAA